MTRKEMELETFEVQTSFGCAKWNFGLLIAISLMWVASSTHTEKPILSIPDERTLSSLETAVAAAPEDAQLTLKLAQRYLDASASGLAVRAVENAPLSVRTQPEVAHLFARALIEQGRAKEALAIERSVHRECLAFDGACTPWLVTSAIRRIGILDELVALGVEDAATDSEASLLAYQHATRQVGFIAQ